MKAEGFPDYFRIADQTLRIVPLSAIRLGPDSRVIDMVEDP